MNNHYYLIEVGIEEMPAQYVREISEQFKERVETFLKENRLHYSKTKAYGTPRRFSVLVEGLSTYQDAFEEEVKGPSKKAALDQDGNWTRAAEGFMRGKGLKPEDLYFKTVKKNDYVFAKIRHEAKSAKELLNGIGEVVEAMVFPVEMYWGRHHFQYIRPVHWLVSLLDKEVVPFEALTLTAGNMTRGHRFLGSQELILTNAQNYEDSLLEEGVIVDQDVRKEKIVQQIHDLEDKEQINVSIDEELLEEVTQIVEYPTVIFGSFDEKYLALPAPVLITSMKDNQRYFAVYTKDGKLSNHFVALRNGNEEGLEMVRKGNEKVLVARLEDALFFVDEDKKRSIDDYAEELKNVTFHVEIGMLKEKMERVGRLAHYFYDKWQMQEKFATLLFDDFSELIDRTAKIYKFDLQTQIVNEFSELQGIIGEIYAKQDGEDEEVASAIREHYMPLSSGGELPTHPMGILFAISDKLDSILSFFKINKIPSGSNDPFALRRQMIGIVSILEAYQLPLNWKEVLPELLKEEYHLEGEKAEKLQDSFFSFLDDRLKGSLEEKGIRFDLSKAARMNTQGDVVQIFAVAEALQRHVQDSNFKDGLEALQRVVNISTKNPVDEERAIVIEDRFENDSEKTLFEAVEKFNSTPDMERYYNGLADLQEPITTYFEENMVMAEDEKVRENRLAQMARLTNLIHYFAAVEEINEKN